MSAEEVPLPDDVAIYSDIPDDFLDEDILADRLEKISRVLPKDYIKYGGYVVMAAAVGAATWWLIKKGRGNISAEDIGTLTLIEGDRHSPGIVSLVQQTGKSGECMPTDLSISLPKAASFINDLKQSSNNKLLFAMQSRGTESNSEHLSFAYPFRDNGDNKHNNKYGEGVRAVAGWLAKALKSKKTDQEPDA